MSTLQKLVTATMVVVMAAGVTVAQDTKIQKKRKSLKSVAPGLESVVSAPAGQKTADEIAKELANPANPMSTLVNQLDFKTYKGDLPGAGDQTSWTYLFQPSVPFNLGDGRTFALRPAIPYMIDQPVYDATTGNWKNKSGFGDISFDSFYGQTRPSGWVTMYGVFGVLPTASDSSLGIDQWRLGPELVLAKVNKWGVVGALVSHVWDVAGEDDFDTSLTSIQYIYSINLGSGYQLASGPSITYDWEALSGQELTVPLGIGLAKTSIFGKMPIKMQFQTFYNVEAPDAFAQDWGFRLSISPVVANPFAK